MRDAIQGMLSMSRMGGLQLSKGQQSPFIEKNKPALQLQREAKKRRLENTITPEAGERMHTAYKDSEYGESV